jgi:FkbM family methyltransferase
MKITKLPSGKTIATIDGDTHIGKWAIESGRLDHDQNMLPLLSPYIPKGGTVLDIGAYIGDHTVFYAERVGERGIVFAFEPNPKAFACLHHNASQYPQVSYYNVGASDRQHSIGIAIDANAGASHAIAEGNIPCVAIDSLNIPSCQFVKLDCEGMEPLAMRGMSDTVSRCRPVMLIEVNAHALERQGFTPRHIFAILKEWGYAWRNIYGEQEAEGHQFDILCTPA